MATAPLSHELESTDDVVVRITETIAKSSDVDPLSLPPLERSVDTDALAALVDSDGLEDITFSYQGHIVTVDGDGHVHIA